MKYLQLASVSTPAAVSTWFQDELVNRGVDAAYTFYVLSLLREAQDPDEVNDHSPGGAHRYPAQANEKPELLRLRAKRCAVECLKGAALEEDSTFESFDALVEELLARLEPPHDSSEITRLTLDNRTSSAAAALAKTTTTSTALTTAFTSTTPQNRSTAPTSKTTATSTTKTATNKTTSQPAEKQSIPRDNNNFVRKEERTLAERAKKYFEAFPALQVQESPSCGRLRGVVVPATAAAAVSAATAPTAAPAAGGHRADEKHESQLRSVVGAKIKSKKFKKRDAGERSSPTGGEAGQQQQQHHHHHHRHHHQHVEQRSTHDATDREAATGCIRPASLKRLEHPRLKPRPPPAALQHFAVRQHQSKQNSVTTSITAATTAATTTTTTTTTTRTSATPATTCATSTCAAAEAVAKPVAGASTTGTRTAARGGMMGSIVHEESLVSSLTKKFDSRLAAIWADAAPVVEEQPSVWRISLDLTASGNRCAAEHDEVIFTIPHSMSHFTTILDDEDDVVVRTTATATATTTATTCCPPPPTATNTIFVRGGGGGDSDGDGDDDGEGADDCASNERLSNERINEEQKIDRETKRSAYDGHIEGTRPSAETVIQNFVLDAAAATAAEKEALGFREAGELHSPPTLCLKNSTLNYDKENTAFTEVVPNSSRTSFDSTSLLPTLAEVPAVQRADCEVCADEDQGEDLLYSLRTHFTPIRADLDDVEDAPVDGAKDRPLSSSLEELSSYRLPPEPPKRLIQKTKQPLVQDVTDAAEPPSKASATHSNVAEDKHDDDVRSLWKMVEFEVPQPAVDGDVLGVAQFWQGTAVNCGVSKELLQEILEEEEELFKDIFEEAMRAASQTSSLTEDANTTSTGYDSYQDTSLEYGAVAGGGDGGLVGAEHSCNIEYLSHFSSGSQLSSVFDTPEAYDSAIVTSVRSIQDMQRQRKRQQKKPCTFYMEGNCRRTDCKFSHDLSNITCRFWEDNSCFKGLACPFLHGYAVPVEDDVSATGSQASSGGSKKETKRSSKFTIDSEQDFPSLCSNAKISSHLKINKKSYKKPGSMAPKKPTAGRRKKKKTSSDSSAKTTSSDSTGVAASDNNNKISKKENQGSNAIKR